MFGILFNIAIFLLVVYLLISRYLEIKMLMNIEKKLEQREGQEVTTEKTKRIHSNVAKMVYASPLKTYKEYDRYKDKKTQLYEPCKPSRGLKIQGEDEA